MKDIIALDMVGVIVDEENIVTKKLYKMLPEPKAVNVEELKLRAKLLRTGKITYADFWKGIAVGNWEEYERKFIKSLNINAGVKNFLETLNGKYDFAIISDMHQIWGEMFLREHGIFDYFKYFVYGDKKSGEAYRKFKAQVKSAVKVIVIDDSTENLDAAKQEGFDVVLFENKENEFNDLCKKF